MPVTRGGGVKKEWKSWEDQVALLKGRHLALDEGEALGLLRTASYSRLSGYARYFQQGAELGGNDFVAGSTLADIKMIHELGGRLRTMLARNTVHTPTTGNSLPCVTEIGRAHV